MNTESCPKCKSTHTYPDATSLWTCTECFHEWRVAEAKETDPNRSDEIDDSRIIDANGNELNDGDSVVVMKDLKIKGASATIKSGTKIRNIRLIANPSDGHNFACKIEGLGTINLKSEFVKKTT